MKLHSHPIVPRVFAAVEFLAIKDRIEPRIVGGLLYAVARLGVREEQSMLVNTLVQGFESKVGQVDASACADFVRGVRALGVATRDNVLAAAARAVEGPTCDAE